MSPSRSFSNYFQRLSRKRIKGIGCKINARALGAALWHSFDSRTGKYKREQRVFWNFTVSESVTLPMGSDLLALAEGVATVVILT